MASREFTDATGVSWTVWEVQPQQLPPKLAKLTGTAEERRRPWLTFAAASGEKRRLVPIPDKWLTCSEFELERWCMRAVPVPPAPMRRERD